MEFAIARKVSSLCERLLKEQVTFLTAVGTHREN